VVGVLVDASDEIFEIARHFRQVERIKQLEACAGILRCLICQVYLIPLPVTSTDVQRNRVAEEENVGDK